MSRLKRSNKRALIRNIQYCYPSLLDMEGDVEIKRHKVSYPWAIGGITRTDWFIQNPSQIHTDNVQQGATIRFATNMMLCIVIQHTVQLCHEVTGECHNISRHLKNVFLNSDNVIVSPRSISSNANSMSGVSCNWH